MNKKKEKLSLAPLEVNPSSFMSDKLSIIFIACAQVNRSYMMGVGVYVCVCYQKSSELWISLTLRAHACGL